MHLLILKVYFTSAFQRAFSVNLHLDSKGFANKNKYILVFGQIWGWVFVIFAIQEGEESLNVFHRVQKFLYAALSLVTNLGNTT